MSTPTGATSENGAIPHRGLVTASIMLATLMQALDTTIANVALPYMQGSLAAGQDQITWVLTSYIVAAAIMTPMSGFLTGRLGIKSVFLLSIAGFTFASVLCGNADSLGTMVVFRTLQGIFGAALIPLSQTVLLDINPREKQGQAMAIWGAGMMVGPILGPTLGGWLTFNYDWRWVFYINLPIGIVTFLGVLFFVRDTVKQRGYRFDFLGFALLSVGVAALQIMLDRGELQDWFGSTEIIIEGTIAALGFWGFVVHTATAKKSFLDPQLLRDRNFVASSILIFMLGVILYATLALLPPLMQDLLDYPVTTAGLILVPRGVSTMIAMLIVGRLTAVIDVRIILLFGLAVTGYSLEAMSGYSLGMGWWPLVVTTFIQGIGLGALFVPLSTVAFATLPPQLRAEGAGFFSLVRNIGGSIGISAAEALADHMTQERHAALADRMTPFSLGLRQGWAQRLWDLHSASGLAALNREITRQASMTGYADDFRAMMLVCLVSVPLLMLVTKPSRDRAAPPVLD